MFAFATSGTDVKLRVPRAWKGKMSLGARNGVRATEQVTIPTYKGSWCLVALSIWIDEPSCPEVIVKTRKEIRRVHVAIDAQCAGAGAGRRRNVRRYR